MKLFLSCFGFLIVFAGSTVVNGPFRWQWSWSCVNHTCVKSSTPDVVSPNIETAFNICKLYCGRYGSLWPMPSGPSTLGSNILLFHPGSINFDYSQVPQNSSAKEILQKMVKIFQDKLFKNCGSHCETWPAAKIYLSFKVSSSNVQLNWETDESYALDISTEDFSDNITKMDIRVKSKTIYGARHALETITQLTNSYTLPTLEKRQVLAMVSTVQIVDFPAYPHRGLVLDTARHYISVASILRTIDALAMVKLNVLHWHVTDSQSFPLEIPSVPKMLRYGAYSSDYIYTFEDSKSIIEYAKLRGVRIIIEVDGPAHAGNGWQWGENSNLGNLALCVNQQPWRKYCIQPPCGQLNPVNPNVTLILKKIFADIIDMLPPGEVFHMGGDEVYFPCWNSSSEVLQWLSDHNYGRQEKDFLNLWGMYQRAVLKAFDESNPVSNVPVILWSSSLTEPKVIEKYLDKNRYVIQTWLEESDPIPMQLLNKGYSIIMSTKDKWYLDHGFWGNTVYHTWKSAYNNRLPRHQNVLGGEGAMWSERVDEYSLDAKIWPRMAAIGERLWTNPQTKADQAETRFENFRERLVSFGINADVTNPYYCYQNEKDCA